MPKSELSKCALLIRYFPAGKRHQAGRWRQNGALGLRGRKKDVKPAQGGRQTAVKHMTARNK